jgi:penicillin-binding protein 1A
MGIDTNKILAVPALALGAAEIPLYEMVQAYGTFANHGQRLKPMMITRIEDADGKVIVENKPIPVEQQERVLSIEEADLMNHLMKKVVAEGTAQKLVYKYGLNFDIAGKTGTSQNNSDGWFIGYTNNLIAGAWVGAETPAVHFKSLELGQGASTALPIWGKFMEKVTHDPKYAYVAEAKFPVYCDSVKHQLLCIPEISENDTTEILEIPAAPDSLMNDIEELIEIPKESQIDKNKNNGGGQELNLNLRR